jgi:hypothetical protein
VAKRTVKLLLDALGRAGVIRYELISDPTRGARRSASCTS